MNQQRLRGLYAVTPGTPADGDLAAPAAAALRGGARFVQYRDKSGDAVRRLDQACQLAALCRAAGARLIINDDPQLALACGADGVHLGTTDMAIADARRLLGAQAIIGATCHASLALAESAIAAGADYLAFGSFHRSATKPEAPVAGIEVLIEARRRFEVPLCAIGGITAGNGPALLAAGADMLAVSSDLFSAADVESRARAYAALFVRP